MENLIPKYSANVAKNILTSIFVFNSIILNVYCWPGSCFEETGYTCILLDSP